MEKDGLLHIRGVELDLINQQNRENNRQHKILSFCFYTFFTMSMISLALLIVSNLNNREFTLTSELVHMTRFIGWTNRLGALVILPLCTLNWVKSIRTGNHWSLLPTMVLFLFFQFILINLYTYNRVIFVDHLRMIGARTVCEMESSTISTNWFQLSTYLPKYSCQISLPLYHTSYDTLTPLTSLTSFRFSHYFPTTSNDPLNWGEFLEHLYIMDLISISYSITLLLTIIILGSLYLMIDFSKFNNYPTTNNMDSKTSY